MKTTPTKKRRNLLLYLFWGLVFGLLLAIVASVVSLISSNTSITLNNILQLHLSMPLFLLIDVYAILFAILFGLIGMERDRSDYAQEQAKWLNQQHTLNVQKLNDVMLSEEQKYKEMEGIISRGKRQWEATFDAVKDLIILTDEAGIILRCNRVTGEVFQTGFSKLIGRQIDELFKSIMEVAPEETLAEKAEIRFTGVDDWYELSKSYVVFDENNSGWVYDFRNVSDRKHSLQEVQRLNQYFQLLVKNSPTAIITLNLEGRVVDCNPAFEKMFGFQKREVVGWNLESLIVPPDLQAENHQMAETVMHRETFHSVTTRQRKDHTLVDVEAFGIPVVLNNKLIGALNLYHDISTLVVKQTPPPAALSPLEEWITELAAEQNEPASGEAESVESPEVEPEPVDEGQVSVSPFLNDQKNEDQAEETAEDTQAGELKDTSGKRAIAIEEIEGIGPVYAQKLSEAGIKTTDDLLNSGSSRKGREELARKLELSSVLLLKWVNMADLMRIKGIGEEYSELLERAGVDTVKELRNRNPGNLHALLLSTNQEHKLVRRPPHLSEVESWVQIAKQIEPVITY